MNYIMQPIGEGINKNIISIHYPGVVKNESKMLETLGGIRNISWVSNITSTCHTKFEN